MSKLRKYNEYLQFIAWTALPSTERQPKKQETLAKQLKVNVSTLSEWKREDDFWDLVRKFTIEWAKNRTSNVIKSIYDAATTPGLPGQAANAKLWLQYIEDWAERQDISLLDPKRENRAKSLLEVYNEFDDGKPAKPTTTARKAKSGTRANKRSTKPSKAARAANRSTKKKRSNKGTH